MSRPIDGGGRKMMSSMKKSSSEKNLAGGSALPYQRPKSGRMKNAWEESAAKPSPRKPTYKSPEEYYDEIMALKKKLQDMNQEKATMKSKLRRLEEENRQKDKQLEGLLDPNKSDELRRTLTDKRADSGAVVHSLKQKILKLETQLKEKEAAHAKLQNDLKTTKIEEMKVQMEVFCQEIARYQSMKGTDKVASPTSSRLQQSTDSDKKLKPLHETIIRLSKQNEALITENKHLKVGLQSALEERSQGNRADMSEEIQIHKNIILQLRDDLNYYKSLCGKNSQMSKSPPKVAARKNKVLKSEKENIQELPKNIHTEVEIHKEPGHLEEVNQLKKTKGVRNIPKGKERKKHNEAQVAQENEQKISSFQQNRAAKKIQREWKSHQDREADRKDMKVRHEKAQNFRQNRAAKKIQNEWVGYQYKKHEAEVEYATEAIQSTMIGHSSRKKKLSSYQENGYEEQPDAEYDSAVELIQSSMKGHSNRKARLNKMKLEPLEPIESHSTPSSSQPSKPKEKTSRFSKFNPFKKKNPPASEKPVQDVIDDDDDIVIG